VSFIEHAFYPHRLQLYFYHNKCCHFRKRIFLKCTVCCPALLNM
jgi:hypothetical protein